MDIPAFLPQSLHYCQNIASEEELFISLVLKPLDLIVFFEIAADDETWSEAHAGLMSQMIEWFTLQGWNDKLSYELQKRIAKALQAHHSILEPMIPNNVIIELNDKTVEVNSLLLSAVSPFFKNLLSVCLEKNTQHLSLSLVSYNVFTHFLTFAKTGNVGELWKEDQRLLESVLRQSLSWGVDTVSKDCQLALKKYIHLENAIDLLLQAQQELWVYFKAECIDYINDKMVGFCLGAPTDERLSFEFYEFSEDTLSVFYRLQGFITDLVCKKTLSEQALFSHVVRQCPKLMMLDISGSLVVSPYLNDVPSHLQGINLTECQWLEPRTIKKIAEFFPALKELILINNYHLNFAFWGELTKFHSLRSLNLTRCRQISDEDLKTIIKSCLNLTDFVLDGCSKIGDVGFFELAKNLFRLTSLSLVSCAISDSALLEIASHNRTLASVNLSRCSQLTEKGFRGLARHAYMLRELNVYRCHISPTMIEEIRRRHPYLRIIN